MSAQSLIKRSVIQAAQTFPSLSNALWKATYPLFRKDEIWRGDEYNSGNKSTFETIFLENRWKSRESRSGDGSSLLQTSFVRRYLPSVVSRIDAKTLLDAPCGDYHWMKSVNFPRNLKYIGGDIVEIMIDELQSKFGDSDHKFIKLDIINGRIPDVDIWLCRDALFHFSNEDIRNTLVNFIDSNVKYLLTTTYQFETKNRDIVTGGFRFLNLCVEPFNLPPPMEVVDDFVFPQPPRVLGLWGRDAIASAIDRG